MKKYIISTEAAQHAMKLTQMGANVKQVSGKLCYVSFDLGYMTLEYVYNINAKGKYFLERIKPYPLPIKAYDNEDDVIDIIEIDVEQFRNAANSSHVSEFITISNKLHETIKKFEDLFLYYNVPAEQINLLLKEVDEMNDTIMETKANSKRVYTKKEPETLK